MLLSFAPFSEIRGALPIAIVWASKNNINYFFVFLLLLIINFLAVVVFFIFMDKFHHKLMNFKIYKNAFNKYVSKTRKKVKKFQSRFEKIGFLAIILFVSVPLPLTGGYSAAFISWALALNRRKSIISIFAGISIAALIIYLTTLKIISY